MNPAERRLPLTLAVAAAAALVVAGVAVSRTALERVVPTLPEVAEGPAAAVFLLAVALLAAIAACVRLAMLARCRSRRRALEGSFDGPVECGVRHSELDAGLAELLGREVHLSHRYSIVADRAGLSFWSGGRKPRRAARFAWREVRSIRADDLVAGSGTAPVVVVRVRRNGSSVALPIILGSERPGIFAVTDAPFYAVIRSWKALHRTALELEGLELPPLTAPIPVITPEMLALAR
ncbi:hypothetical protein ACWKWP_08105 [Agromyces soli]